MDSLDSVSHYTLCRPQKQATAVPKRFSLQNAPLCRIIILLFKHIEEDIMHTYTWYQWLTFFYLYCFFGWIFESAYVSLLKRRFVNRGFLRIPMLPLYGSGAVMMLVVSEPFQDSLFLTWFSGVIGATILEYVTGWAMEQLFKVRYWDYSNQKFNLHGYICLSSSIAWGFLTIFMTHVIHKPIERAILSMPVLWDVLFAAVVTVIFTADAVVCTREALAFGKSLEAVRKLRQDLDILRVQTALLRMDAEDRLHETRADLEERLAERRADLGERLTERRADLGGHLAGRRADLEARLEELRSRTGNRLEGLRGKSESQLLELLKKKEASLAAIRERRRKFLRSVLRSNPTASSRRYKDEFQDMIHYLEDSGKGQSPF